MLGESVGTASDVSEVSEVSDVSAVSTVSLAEPSEGTRLESVHMRDVSKQVSDGICALGLRQS